MNLKRCRSERFRRILLLRILPVFFLFFWGCPRWGRAVAVSKSPLMPTAWGFLSVQSPNKITGSESPKGDLPPLTHFHHPFSFRSAFPRVAIQIYSICYANTRYFFKKSYMLQDFLQSASTLFRDSANPSGAKARQNPTGFFMLFSVSGSCSSRHPSPTGSMF